MEQYKFSEFDKIAIVEGGVDYRCHFCPTDGVFLKYKNISDCKCPFCGKVCDPIENVRELRKKFKKELDI